MSDNIKNFIRAVKQIRMTEAERAVMRAHLSPLSAAEAPRRSPYFSRLSFPHVLKVASLVVLFLVLGVSGLSYASASALPGELLYNIKIHFKEPIEEKLAFSPEKRIALREQRINARFSEVETLIKEKKITPADKTQADTNIEQTKQEISADLEEINKADPQAATDAKTDLDASIQASQQKIDNLIQQTGTDLSTPADGGTDSDGDLDVTVPGDDGSAATSTDGTIDGSGSTGTGGTGSVDDGKTAPDSGSAAPSAPANTPDGQAAQGNQ